jgi:hypothetical protein
MIVHRSCRISGRDQCIDSPLPQCVLNDTAEEMFVGHGFSRAIHIPATRGFSPQRFGSWATAKAARICGV